MSAKKLYGSDSSQFASLAPAGPSKGADSVSVQSITQLMYKDKGTIMLKAVELIINVLQQKEQIAFLQRTIGVEKEQKEQMQRELHDQQSIGSLMGKLESQKQTISRNLGVKADFINAQIKSNQVVSRQVQKEITIFSNNLNDFRSLISNAEERGKHICREFGMAKIRIETLNKDIRSMTALNAKLCSDVNEKKDQITKRSSKYEDLLSKSKNKILEKENRMKQQKEELKKVIEKINEYSTVNNDLQLEHKSLERKILQLKQKGDSESCKIQQEFAKQQHVLQQQLKDATQDWEHKIKNMENMITGLVNEKDQNEDKCAQIEVTLIDMSKELNAKNEQCRKLQLQLKETEKDSKREMSQTNKRNRKFDDEVASKQQTRHVSDSKHASKESSLVSDFDFDKSYHYDNAESCQMMYNNVLRK